MTADQIAKPSLNSLNVQSNISKKADKTSSAKSKVKKTCVTVSNNDSSYQSLNTILIPVHFKNILDIFVSLDVVVNKLSKQRTSIYIDKVAEVLKEMNINNFDIGIFGQILRIFPESYSYEFDSPPLKVTRHYKEKMKIIPNFNFGNKSDFIPKKSQKVFRLDQLVSRMAHLYECLLGKVQERHNEFLLINKNLSKVEMEMFTLNKKWHEDFNLETSVQPIEPITLDRNNLKQLSKKSSDKIAKSPLSASNNKRTLENVKSTSKSSLSLSNRSPSVGIINKGKMSMTNLSATDGKENKNCIKSSNNQHLSTKPLNERNVIVPSKSPLSVLNRSSVGIINKGKMSMTNLSSTNGKENKNPIISVNNQYLSTKPLNDINIIVPSKSPLSVSNRSSVGIINKGKMSMTNLSSTNGKENKNQIKWSNNEQISPTILKEKLIKKSSLSNENNSNDLKPSNQNAANESSKSKDSPIDKSIQRKSSKLTVRFSTEDARQSNSDRKAFQSINRIPLRKSAITPSKTTPKRSENPPSVPNSGSKPTRSQPRLSFISNSNGGTPNGKNFLASVAMPNSPMLKTEFVLKQKLPAHLKVLYESFQELEKLIYDNRRKCATTYLRSAVEHLSNHRQFTECQLGKILAVYPEAYSVRLQHVPSKNGLRSSTNKIDIAIRPNLESSNFLKFDFATMKKRGQKFLENCVQIVVSSYREFILNKSIIHVENVEEHIRTEDWNCDFNIELDVKTVEPVPMPQKSQQKELENARLTFSVMKKNNKPTEFDSSKVSPLKTGDNHRLGSLSQSLIDKVRMNKANRSVITGAPATIRRNFMASKLPEIATIIANEFKMFDNKPLERSQLVNLVCKSLQLNESSFSEYLDMLEQVVPGWVKDLNWAVPRLTIGTPDLSLDEVLLRLNANVAKQQPLK